MTDPENLLASVSQVMTPPMKPVQIETPAARALCFDQKKVATRGGSALMRSNGVSGESGTQRDERRTAQ